MKKRFLLLSALALVLVLAAAALLYPQLSARYAPAQSTPEPAQSVPEPALEPAPDFTVADAEGNTVRLSDFFGQPLVVNFWATWCGPCQAELPAFDSAAAAYAEEVRFLMVNLTDGARDTVEGVQSFVAAQGYAFPVYFDTEGAAATAYGVYSIPATVFIDADGRIASAHVGMMTEEALTAEISTLTGGNAA